MEESATPIIVQNSPTTPKKSIFPGVPSSLPSIVFVILVLVIVGELIWGVWYILKPSTPSYIAQASRINPVPVKAEAYIELISPTSETEVAVGDLVPVQVYIGVSGSNSYSSDLVIKYDPAILSLQGTPNTIFTKGDLYPDYLGQESTSGTFSVSGISNTPSGVETDELFGTINFKAIQSGKATVSVEFSEGKTDESNVIDDQGEDILNDVTNLEIDVL